MGRGEAESHLWAIEAAVEGVLACLEGLSVEELAWRPPVIDDGSGPGAQADEGGGGNTLYAVATHVMGNAEQNFVEYYAHQPVSRVRRTEFLAQGPSAQSLREGWATLPSRLRDAVTETDAAELLREREHLDFGRLSGREVLLICIAHANQHRGEAQLIRDLIFAKRRSQGGAA